MMARSGPGKPGRPRNTQVGFTFKPGELKVETFGSHTHARAIITHLPTGLSAEGHDPVIPGSVLAAKVVAIHALGKKVEEHEREALKAGSQDAPDSPGEAPGTPHPANP